jgi:glycosyltransferase involved in cell wall biosynthesis
VTGRPWLYIVDASVDRTGALTAAGREARCLAPVARVALVLPSATRVKDEDLSEFDKVLRLPMVQLRKSLASILLYVPSLLYCGWRLRRATRADGCTRLQMNDFYLMQGVMARFYGYRGTLATWVRIDPLRFGVLGRMWLWLGRWASNHLVAVSHFIEHQLGDGIAPVLIYDPYLDPVDGTSQEAGPERLVFIGNYIEGKGQDKAIAAFDRIAARFPQAELAIFGGDMGLAKNRAYREKLEAQARASKAAERIHFGGFVLDTRRALRSARVALNFSTSESFSLTCQEASACGVAVIATRCGGPAEIVEDGVTGFLVDVGDVEAMADRMARLLADPQLASEMGRRGATLVKTRFSTEAFRSRLETLFELNGL